MIYQYKGSKMKKIFYVFLGIMCFLLLGIYTLLFTTAGNSFLKPRLETIITKKSGINIQFDQFQIRFSTLNIKANIDNKFFADVKGDISPFSLGFDLDYIIGLQNQYTKELNLDNKQDLTFKGKILGKSSDFIVNGKGFLFNSNLSLNTKLVNYNVENLELLGKDIDIAQILDFASLPRYIHGKINLLVTITTQNSKPNGNALINFYTSSINNNLIYKDFNLTLPKQSFVKGEIKSLIQDKLIISTSTILSNFFNLNTDKSVYNLANNILESDFNIKINDFDQFSSILKTKLQGKSQIQGNLKLTNNQLQEFNATLLGFGGELKAIFADNILNINTNTIEIDQILKTFSIPSVVDSKLDFSLNAKGLDCKNFNALVKLDNAKINTAEFRKLSGLDFPQTNFNLQAKADAKDFVIAYKAALNSNIATISNLNGTYNLNDKDLKIDLSAFVDNLNKLKVLTKQDLNGPLNINTKLNLQANTIKDLDANIEIMQGKINAKSNGNNLEATIDNVKLEQIFPLIGQQILAYGDIDANVKLDSLDFSNINGKFNANIDSAFNELELSKLLKKQFPKNTSAKINLDGNIKNSLLDFNAKVKSSFANIDKFQGKLDFNKQSLQSIYEISLDDFSKLGFLVDRKLHGNAKFNGKLNFENQLIDASIISEKIFNGQLNVTIKNNIIKANIDNVDLSNLAQSLDFPDYYEAKSNVKVDYNLLKENGEVLLDLNNGKLKKNLITSALMILLQKDITEDVYKNGKASAIINKNIIDLNLDLFADRSKINITNGKIDTKSTNLNIPFNIIIDRANFKGAIKGTTQNPKVDLNAGSVVKSIANTLGGNTSDAAKNTGKKVDQAIDKVFNKIF